MSERGNAILVANHSGTVPLDVAMLMHAVRSRAGRQLRPLVENSRIHAPYVGKYLNRLGAVRACHENANRLLAQDRLVAVFPEGTKGTSKLYRERYRLQRFGRGGFVKLALRTGAPIIPVAVIGAEDTYPVLARLRSPAGLPRVPVTPTFPWLGALGLLPLPSKWQILIGSPIDLRSEHGAEAASNRPLVNDIAEGIRRQIQTSLNSGIASRNSLFS
jgi:1-acyl-sn-glycerol-3-phosphate acyltransferase